MRLPPADHIWTVAGMIVFVLGGYFLATGRFGAGAMLMAGAALCLGTAMAQHRRRVKKEKRP